MEILKQTKINIVTIAIKFVLKTDENANETLTHLSTCESTNTLFKNNYTNLLNR